MLKIKIEESEHKDSDKRIQFHRSQCLFKVCCSFQRIHSTLHENKERPPNGGNGFKNKNANEVFIILRWALLTSKKFRYSIHFFINTMQNFPTSSDALQRYPIVVKSDLAQDRS